MSKNIKSIITCDLDGKIETFSKGAQKLFGYSADEIIGKARVSDFSAGEIVLGHVVNWLEESVEKGKWEGDSVFLHKDGHEMPCKIKITPTKDKNGNHIGYCGITTPLNNKTAASVRPNISFATKIFCWMVIMRLPFLSATIVPILLGATVASRYVSVDWFYFALTMLGGSLLHIGTNTSNDYFDHTSGTDEANYNYMVPFSGGSRSIQMGLISAKGMLYLSMITFALSGLIGIPLIIKAGINILYLGFIGFLSGFFYTAPPFRFASRKGIGELLIGLNFGPLMVVGSFLVQTSGDLTHVFEAALAGIPIGLLVAAIVYVNQFPDHDGDKATGKNNLVVVFGPEKARIGYVLLVVGAFVSIIVMALNGIFPMLSLITLFTSIISVYTIRTLYKYYNNRLLQPANAGTIGLHFITGVFFCVGIWLG
ncbi:MAG: UbiA family prenyltransferase [Candidatus Neomarinimicrobiota bacterium]|nr:UbiA family prenyltransferase [Candidatus Neomarinimicrobiota bacterium]